MATPLADRIRPQSIEEMVGQEHLIGENKPLPMPTTNFDKVLQAADYLASRKCLNMSFDDYVLPKEESPNVAPGDYQITFGKYKDSTLKEIPKDYLQWMLTQDKFPVKEPLKTFTMQVLKGE